ncbi:hypothetical protein E2562_021848 [Oryza meyeriana var. granulata]|uniref:Uncharacterized protein n=1 Tax=Oryza meyeriana var. granulata TaxID=110450 RepID=A0A6G1C8F2_9ORYZ|nr:hypothetical protein E2562_021848 [Oryza meyeriana var. granulata]
MEICVTAQAAGDGAHCPSGLRRARRSSCGGEKNRLDGDISLPRGLAWAGRRNPPTLAQLNTSTGHNGKKPPAGLSPEDFGPIPGKPSLNEQGPIEVLQSLHLGINRNSANSGSV